MGAPVAAPDRRSHRRRLAGLAAGLAVCAGLGYALAAGWGRVSSYDWSLRPGWLALGLAALAAFYAVSGDSYAAIVERLTPAAPWRRVTVSIWARSLLGRYVPGTVLMVLGRVVLSHEAGVPRRVTLAATVYEQAFAVSVAALGSVALLIGEPDIGLGAPTWLVALTPLGLVVLHPAVFAPLSAWVLRRLGREPLSVTLSVRQIAGLLVRYAVVSALLAVGVWALVRSAAGPEAGGLAYVGAAFLIAFVVSTLTVVLPAGIGVRDGAFALALAQHVPGGVAVAVSVGVRLVMTLVEVGFVVAAVLIGRRR